MIASRRFHILSFPLIILVLTIQACDAASTPVVGILTQPRTVHHNHTQYYVAASYVKWLELAGARAIPIPYDASDKLVDEIFSQVNGILFPGGTSDLPPSATRIWKRALDDNARGVYFPIWATCLGYEYLLMLASSQGESILQQPFDAENVSLPLKLVNGQHSRLYASKRIQHIVRTENVTLHNHFKGLEPTMFAKDEGLTSMFRVTSMNHDRKGRPFVSTVEPISPDKHPFYGVQYHPEKNAFEYGTASNTNVAYENINHSPDGIYFSVYTAQFFGKMLQHTPIHSYSETKRHPLVYSYPMKRKTAFEQVYIIPSANHWEHIESNHYVFLRRRIANNTTEQRVNPK